MWKTIGPFALGLALGGIPVTAAVIHRLHRPTADRAPASPASVAQPDAPAAPIASAASPAGDEASAVDSMPWLKRVPGEVNPLPPSVAAASMQRYQAFAEGRSWPAEVAPVDTRGLLGSRLGLQKGDRIISVNGVRVGGWSDASQITFVPDGETTMTIVVERDGQRRVLSYDIAEGE